jgi:hypothetical protein
MRKTANQAVIVTTPHAAIGEAAINLPVALGRHRF